MCLRGGEEVWFGVAQIIIADLSYKYIFYDSIYRNIQMKTCIHTQTYSPHFKYTNELILSFLELTNIRTLKIPIFIILDDDKSIDEFKKKYNYDYDLIYLLNTEDIINNFHLEFTENNNDLFQNVINVKWGAGGHRNYVAVKRTYSILELERMGYDYVWCLDCESLVLKKTDIQTVIDSNIKKPLLTVGKTNNGVKYPQIIETLFCDSFSEYKDISVRMNDFWFIHTKYYKSMIQFLFNIHKRPISYFVNGSEQSLYEYYLYSLYLKDPNTIDLIVIDNDLHNNTLFSQIINSNANLDIFCQDINDKYFNYIQSYRGDYYNSCLKSDRGKYLISKLNINIAVSNYQGV